MTKQEFIEGFSPRNFPIMAMDEARCHIGSSPTVEQATAQYGPDTLVTIITTYIHDLCKFCHARAAFDGDAITDIALIVATQYRYLKVAEIGLFFIKYKAGYFGKVFRELYALDITTALIKWRQECVQRKNELTEARIQQEDREFRAALATIREGGSSHDTSSL